MKRLSMLTPVLMALLLSSCAKKLKEEKAYKGIFNQDKKTIPCVDSPCLYLPSVVETPREVTASRPHWMGEAKLVKFKIREEYIEVVELEKDKRFDDNEQNSHPVINIPVKHIDYQCKKDEFGQCTNKEEEDKDKRWDQKKRVDIDFSDMKVLETNFLPISLDNLFGNCYAEQAQRITDVKVDGTSVNIELEKTFKTNIDCAEELNSLSHLTFAVKYHYSFIQLDQLASKDYEKVLYSKESENKFGFFTTDHDYIDVDNRNTDGTEFKLLNRWNPNRGAIPYLLSDNFYKEENKVLLESTKIAIEKINKSLKLANSSLSITLEKANGRAAGDLKNNVIALVEDPQASGIIGYGPTVTNPATGEIIHGRTVMYAGTMKKFIRRAYDELIELEELDLDDAIDRISSAAKDLGLIDDGIKSDVSKVSSIEVPLKNFDSKNNSKLFKNIGSLSKEDLSKGLLNNRNTLQSKGLTSLLHRNDQDSLAHIGKFEKAFKQVEELSKENYYHADNFNFIGAAQACDSKKILKEKLGGSLRPWESLSDTEKTIVNDTLMPCSWIPTLVHEFGHNLGLRHNFNGSEDKDNYYTDAQLKLMGINHSISYSSIMDYSYSSINELPVMGKYDIAALQFGYAREVQMSDGSVSKISEEGDVDSYRASIESRKKDRLNLINLELTKLHKSLKAKGVKADQIKLALKEKKSKLEKAIPAVKEGNFEQLLSNIESEKFKRDEQINEQIEAYTLELKVSGVDSVEISKKVSAKKEELEIATPKVIEIKDYAFCTDEHVSANAACNRFDEGSSLTEIAKHYVSSFKKTYERRNKKGDNQTFSIYEDASYFSRVYSTMRGLRLFFELYDRITGMYPEETKPDSPLWESMEFLKDIKGATYEAGNFFIDTIKTPGLHCMVSLPTGGLAIVPISNVAPTAITCFDEENVQLRSGFEVIGEVGKLINNKKDPRNNNPYVDQIDVRGVWMDKVLAAHFLTTRELGSSIFDSYTKNFLDISDFREKTISALSELMMDQIKTNKVDIKLADGTYISADDENNPFNNPEGYTFNASDDHVIVQSLHGGINRMFGLYSAKTNILKPMILTYNQQGASREDIEDSSKLLKLFRVTKTIGDATGIEKTDELIIDSGRFIALRGNSLASTNIQLYKKIIAAEKMDKKDLESALYNLEKPDLVKIKIEARAKDLKEKLAQKQAELEDKYSTDPDSTSIVDHELKIFKNSLEQLYPEIESSNVVKAKKLGPNFIRMFLQGTLPSKNNIVEVLGILPENFATDSNDTI